MFWEHWQWIFVKLCFVAILTIHRNKWFWAGSIGPCHGRYWYYRHETQPKGIENTVIPSDSRIIWIFESDWLQQWTWWLRTSKRSFMQMRVCRVTLGAGAKIQFALFQLSLAQSHRRRIQSPRIMGFVNPWLLYMLPATNPAIVPCCPMLLAPSLLCFPGVLPVIEQILHLTLWPSSHVGFHTRRSRCHFEFQFIWHHHGRWPSHQVRCMRRVLLQSCWVPTWMQNPPSTGQRVLSAVRQGSCSEPYEWMGWP